MAEGRGPSWPRAAWAIPRRGRQTFRRYVTEEWLPHHVIEVTTREAYTYQLNKHIMPWFGPMRMNEIMPSHVREWVTDLQAKGVTPATIQKVRFILSAIFTAALNDVTYLHPCKGVKTPTVPRKPLKIITPEQFDAIYAAIPGAILQLLVETDIETGLRWGELTELRVKDLDPYHAGPDGQPDGRAGRSEIPPNRRAGSSSRSTPRTRNTAVSSSALQLAGKIGTHITGGGLGPGDLIFPMPPQDSPAARLRAVPDLASLGFTKPNAAGRQYRHGTMSGYNAGRCRCQLLQGRRRDLPGAARAQQARTLRAGHGRWTPTVTSPATGSG